jgi:ATP-dependent RNA helicase RhlE
LALQVEEQFKIFGSKAKIRTVTVYGGTGYDRQIRALKRGVDVIIATPGRLLDLLERKLVNIKMVEMFVLDEADRLLDMGFMPQVRRIATQLQTERQTIMFSATIDRKVERIASEFLINPTVIRANESRVEPAEIEQIMHFVTEFGKDALLLKVIQDSGVDSMLVFTKTKRKASWVTNRLQDSKVKAEEIHGDVSQAQRERTLERFRRGEFAVLVATDVAARGLDVPAISHVINYDLPTSPEDYVHRIGRTGRMGRSGIAISFVSDEDRYMVRDIEKVIGKVLDPDSQSRKVLSTPRRPMRGTRRRVVG